MGDRRFVAGGFPGGLPGGGVFLKKDATNLRAMLWTWQNADLSANPVFGGDLKKALGAIKARAVVPSPEIELDFPPEDHEWEVEPMANAVCRRMPGVWGPFAGGGVNPVDTQRRSGKHISRTK